MPPTATAAPPPPGHHGRTGAAHHRGARPPGPEAVAAAQELDGAPRPPELLGVAAAVGMAPAGHLPPRGPDLGLVGSGWKAEDAVGVERRAGGHDGPSTSTSAITTSTAWPATWPAIAERISSATAGSRLP